MSVDCPGHADYPSSAFAAKTAPQTHVVYAVIWMEYEYEDGFGTRQDVSHITLARAGHLLTGYVMNDLMKYGDKSAMLMGAGDYFCYPAGPNYGYNLYKIEIDDGTYKDLSNFWPSTKHLSKDSTCDNWRAVYAACQNPLETNFVPSPRLFPKPMTDIPHIIYPDASQTTDEMMATLVDAMTNPPTPSKIDSTLPDPELAERESLASFAASLKRRP